MSEFETWFWIILGGSIGILAAVGVIREGKAEKAEKPVSEAVGFVGTVFGLIVRAALWLVQIPFAFMRLF